MSPTFEMEAESPAGVVVVPAPVRIRPIEVVVSIWPMREFCYRPLHIPTALPGSKTNHFIIEPGSPDKPSFLPVGHYIAEVYESSDQYGNRKYRRQQIDATDIANDLIGEWSKNKGIPDSRPGIFLCPLEGNFKIADLKLTAEYQAALKDQNKFARLAVAQARQNYGNQKYHWNTELHQAMAGLLGVKNEAWQTYDIKVGTALSPCKWCQTPISAEVIICPQCRQIVNQAAYDLLSAPTTPAKVVK